MRLCVPARLDIGNGFLINSFDETSTQVDVVIYDKSSTPRIESREHQTFYTVESICAIGEAKSRLTKEDLQLALNKLARVKQKCDQVSSTVRLHRDTRNNSTFDRKNKVEDQVISFLICERFDFNFSDIQCEVSSWYDDDVEDQHKHNLVLSVEDGLLHYSDGSERSWMYPPSSARPAKGL